MLCGSNLVMLRFGIDAELPKLFIQVLHKGLNARLDRTEIMILHFLPLRRLCSEQSAAGENEIFTLIVKRFVYQKVFLFRTNSCDDAGCVCVAEQAKNTQSLFIRCV